MSRRGADAPFARSADGQESAKPITLLLEGGRDMARDLFADPQTRGQGRALLCLLEGYGGWIETFPAEDRAGHIARGTADFLAALPPLLVVHATIAAPRGSEGAANEELKRLLRELLDLSVIPHAEPRP